MEIRLCLIASIYCLILMLPVSLFEKATAQHHTGLSGYLIYCPCMGRFGNQAEQFLGSLAFAQRLGRTLVVPPWITYGRPTLAGAAGVSLVPFSQHFNLTYLAAGHPTISMEQFMAKLAPALWPAGSRTVFCHSPREDGTCQAKFGSPFGPFWDAFGVVFDREEFYSQTVGGSLLDGAAWRQRYPSNRFPVLAFMGAPAAYPALPQDLPLHRHVTFNADFLLTVEELMARLNLQRPILAVHLRNNVDFTGACSSLVGRLPPGRGLFSSYQCFGPDGSLGQLSMDTCAPDDATLSGDVARLADAIQARTVFVATDFDARLELLRPAVSAGALGGRVRVIGSPQAGTDVFQDVALMSLADAALLNCASSLSAFVRRTRDAAGRPTEYLGRAGAPNWRGDSRDEL